MKQATIVAIVLAVLVLISAVQAFQLNALKTKVEEGGLKLSSSSSGSSVASSGGGGRSTGSLPSSIRDLPQMVGGC
tara:strand:+ start:1635 stop:1862 length:228 start_codon:yes stop_codon:yes gene_type:complete